MAGTPACDTAITVCVVPPAIIVIEPVRAFTAVLAAIVYDVEPLFIPCIGERAIHDISALAIQTALAFIIICPDAPDAGIFRLVGETDNCACRC